MSLKKPIHLSPLIEDCLAQKPQAAFKLYQQYHLAMYNTALRIIKDPDQAEDIMQESFINAFNKLSQFSGEVAFGAWLKKIVINNAIAAYRKQKKENAVPLEEANQNHLWPPADALLEEQT